MKFKFDHDLHIHSYLSECSSDPEQNKYRILQYAKDNNLRTLCLTDHMWDDAIDGAIDWYKPQNYAHICEILPLPQDKYVRFFFGCETEVDKYNTLAISKKVMDELDFVVIPTTHFHMTDFTISKEDATTHEGMAKNWIERFEAVLDMDLPFYKVGIAHLTCTAIGPGRGKLLETVKAIPELEMERLFKKAAKVGVGIEINSDDMIFESDEAAEIIAKPYRIAKDCGCKFYLGSDAHNPHIFDDVAGIFDRAIDLIGLEESDKIDFLKY